MCWRLGGGSRYGGKQHWTNLRWTDSHLHCVRVNMHEKRETGPDVLPTSPGMPWKWRTKTRKGRVGREKHRQCVQLNNKRSGDRRRGRGGRRERQGRWREKERETGTRSSLSSKAAFRC